VKARVAASAGAPQQHQLRISWQDHRHSTAPQGCMLIGITFTRSGHHCKHAGVPSSAALALLLCCTLPAHPEHPGGVEHDCLMGELSGWPPLDCRYPVLHHKNRAADIWVLSCN
jgi:hypothetical protein